MRAYFFGNLYFSSIQQGIQAAHTVVEMFTKYGQKNREIPDGIDGPCQEWQILHHWATEHKTMVLLNGGYAEELRSLIQFFSSKENPLPWAYFNESKEAADNCLTCVGIILPEEFYEGARDLKGPSGYGEYYAKLLPGWERTLAERLNMYGLAR